MPPITTTDKTRQMAGRGRRERLEIGFRRSWVWQRTGRIDQNQIAEASTPLPSPARRQSLDNGGSQFGAGRVERAPVRQRFGSIRSAAHLPPNDRLMAHARSLRNSRGLGSPRSLRISDDELPPSADGVDNGRRVGDFAGVERAPEFLASVLVEGDYYGDDVLNGGRGIISGRLDSASALHFARDPLPGSRLLHPGKRAKACGFSTVLVLKIPQPKALVRLWAGTSPWNGHLAVKF